MGGFSKAIYLAFYIRDAHWRYLANTTEPSMCGGDAALCQITLTTCYYRCCRRKNFRLLTILKNINDRIGRGASPPPRMRDDVVQRVPRRNTSSSGCASVDDCDERPLTSSSQTSVDHVHVVAQSCKRPIILDSFVVPSLPRLHNCFYHSHRSLQT